jgi:hypothetical protein
VHVFATDRRRVAGTGPQGQYAALNGPVGALADGNGYLMIGCGGGINSFSDRPSLGSLGENPPPNPIVAVATWQA